MVGFGHNMQKKKVMKTNIKINIIPKNIANVARKMIVDEYLAPRLHLKH